MNAPLWRILPMTLLLCSLAACSPGKSGEGVQLSLDKTGIVASDGVALYTGDDPKLTWSRALDFGASVKLTGDGQPREFQVGSQKLTLVPVELSGTNPLVAGWLPQAQFAAGGFEAATVVADRSKVYEKASGESGVLATLSRGALVGLARQKDSGGFFRVWMVDPVGQVPLSSAYLSENDVTFDQGDVKAALALAKAKTMRDPAEQRTLLEEAKNAFGGSRFGPDLDLALGKQATPPTGPKVEELVASMTVGEENAPVHQEPDEGSPVVGTLKMDAEINVQARTADLGSLGGRKARWYRLEGDEARWVFGAFLVGAD